MRAIDAIENREVEHYQPFHATRADFLARAGRPGEAIAAYDRAIALTTNPTERAFLVRRRALVTTD